MSAIETRNRSFWEHVESGGVGRQRGEVLTLWKKSRRPMTLREICSATGLTINAVSGRVHELKELGLLEECEPVRCPVTGRSVTPVRITK